MNVRELPFPLNFYGTVLKQEYGHVEFLTYGCYECQEPAAPVPINAAQWMLMQKIIARVEAHTETALKILVLGASQLKLADKLKGAGHEVVFPEPEGQGFDVMVLEAGYSHEQQLDLFSQARKLLKQQGKLLLVNEFIDDDSKIAVSDRPNLSSCRQLAKRLGFKLMAELDFSADAHRSLQDIQALARKHRQALLQQLSLSEVEYSRHLARLEHVAAEFATGRRGFRLFEFTNKGDSDSEWANAEYGDISSFETAEIGRLFEKSFNVAFDAKVWDWKYKSGNGRCVVARDSDGGEVIAHYGGAPRPILYFGTESMAIQVCDVMVLPEKRLYYGKKSLFFKVAATFLEREIGNTVDHLLGFGFPNQKAMNIAMRLGLYEKTDDFLEVVLPPAESAGSFQLIEVDIGDASHQNSIDSLWQSMAKDLLGGIVGIRNWQYLKYRYFDHPYAQAGQYQCCLLRKTPADPPLAVLVFKPHEDRFLLMDIICQQRAILAAVTAANAALTTLKEMKPNVDKQVNGLKIWITRAWLESVMPVGATVNELHIEIPCNSWNPGPDSARLNGAWWLTAGDMDFM